VWPQVQRITHVNGFEVRTLRNPNFARLTRNHVDQPTESMGRIEVQKSTLPIGVAQPHSRYLLSAPIP
jgi:hypothetical protein